MPMATRLAFNVSALSKAGPAMYAPAAIPMAVRNSLREAFIFISGNLSISTDQAISTAGKLEPNLAIASVCPQGDDVWVPFAETCGHCTLVCGKSSPARLFDGEKPEAWELSTASLALKPGESGAQL